MTSANNTLRIWQMRRSGGEPATHKPRRLFKARPWWGDCAAVSRRAPERLDETAKPAGTTRSGFLTSCVC